MAAGRGQARWWHGGHVGCGQEPGRAGPAGTEEGQEDTGTSRTRDNRTRAQGTSGTRSPVGRGQRDHEDKVPLDKHPWGPGAAGTSGTKGLRAGKSWIRGEGKAQKSGWRGNQGQEVSLPEAFPVSQHGAVVPAISPKSLAEDSPRSIYTLAFGQPSPVPSLDTPLLLWGTRGFLSCSSYSGGAACSAQG